MLSRGAPAPRFIFSLVARSSCSAIYFFSRRAEPLLRDLFLLVARSSCTVIYFFSSRGAPAPRFISSRRAEPLLRDLFLLSSRTRNRHEHAPCYFIAPVTRPRNVIYYKRSTKPNLQEIYTVSP